MKRIFHRRPSASMVVAMTALVIATTGTAVAATLVSGDKLIKKHSLSGNRLKNHTLTGTQVNLSKLGKVPSATNADHATSATTATAAGSAVTATNATNAINAAALGGAPANAYEPGIRSGLVTATSGQTVALATFGAFTLKLVCTAGTGAAIEASITASSTVANSEGAGIAMPTAGTAVTVDDTGAATTTPSENSAYPPDFLTPTGQTYIANLTVGQNSMGLTGKCYANSLISPS